MFGSLFIVKPNNNVTNPSKPNQTVTKQNVSAPVIKHKTVTKVIPKTETTEASTKEIEKPSQEISTLPPTKNNLTYSEKKQPNKKIKEVEEKEIKKEKEKETIAPKQIVFNKIKSNTFFINKTPSKEKLSLLKNNFAGHIIPEKQNLFIYASNGDTWITYKIDDKKIRKNIIRKGESKTLVGTTIRVYLGNVNVIDLFLNNKHINVVSRNGVKSMVFPASSANEFVTPLFIFNEDGTVVTSKEYQERNQEGPQD